MTVQAASRHAEPQVDLVQVTAQFPFQGQTKNMVKYHAGPEHKQGVMGTVYVPLTDAPPAPVVEVTITIPRIGLS